MNRPLTVCTLIIGLTAVCAPALQRSPQPTGSSLSKTPVNAARHPTPWSYQRQDIWYEFMLTQFNPDKIDYGDWVEQKRRDWIEHHLENPYFLYSFWVTIALVLATAVWTKCWIDHRRSMWITAEMMADLYNQDAYSRQAAQEAIERYNKHIEHCNRAIETGENNSLTGGSSRESEQLKTELMRVAEERDAAIRDRDIARDDLRRKSEIMADMSIRLETATNKAGAPSAAKANSDLRSADTRLVTHINNLQEQLYAERSNSHRLRGG